MTELMTEWTVGGWAFHLFVIFAFIAIWVTTKKLTVDNIKEENSFYKNSIYDE